VQTSARALAARRGLSVEAWIAELASLFLADLTDPAVLGRNPTRLPMPDDRRTVATRLGAPGSRVRGGTPTRNPVASEENDA
jgi:hypothetical protein